MTSEKLIINIELDGKDRETFEELKTYLGVKQNTAVLRVALNHTRKDLLK